MKRHSQPRSRPLKTVTPLKVSQRRTGGVEEDKFLDRWSPKLDKDHYSRVRLHRERKDSVTRFRRGVGQRSSSLYRVRACANDDVGSLRSFDSECTSSLSPAASFVFSDLGSTLRDELDHYDDQIKTLQPGEWPAPPNARAGAFRVSGKEFSMERAKALKSWGFAQGMMYGSSSASLRDTDKVHPASSYKPGVIFSAPHHTAGSDDLWVSVNDPYNTATPFGKVHSKYRKMVVIRAFGEHCICLPIYSHNGKGLEGKDNLIEYVSIRDAADRNPEKAEGMHNRLLAVGNDDFRGKIVAGKSCIKLTELTSHRYDVPTTIEGRLEEKKSDSKEELLALVDMMST
ncbi:hypothetical protein F5B22DRAFT_646913 [Xylaria bambusicola]|uniref:uncharacterized protein n=1 Tax=Xylaria bambusicola TaxID=326684 RepID=UPI0020083C96|nr:uncharacterized protein F5B22DRAFT_646913 [Xylaria bambusicola]KAI0515034.1 hypothetical protein F5B22DRAFT_646913 [Xylaria bambusicola]